MGAGALLALGILLFLAAEGCILSGMAAGGNAPCDYVIVLGAQVRGTQVSRALKQRLDRAAEYLEEHPDTVVIVSGGQGSGEDITEAQAMEEYLIGAGIAPERIWKEEASVNTVQNIRFSRALIEEEAPVIGIVSNDFSCVPGGTHREGSGNRGGRNPGTCGNLHAAPLHDAGGPCSGKGSAAGECGVLTWAEGFTRERNGI